MNPQLRASNECLLTPRVARQRGLPGHPALLADFFSILLGHPEGTGSSVYGDGNRSI